MKRCPKCGLIKSRDEFHNSSKRPDGKEPWCKPCHAEKYQQRKAADPEKVRQQSQKSNKLYGQRHPDRTKASSDRYNAKRRAQNAERKAANAPPEGFKKCADCGELKIMSEFPLVKRRTGYRPHAWCFDCKRKKARIEAKIRREANPQKFKDRVNARRKTSDYKEWEAEYRKRDDIKAIRKLRDAVNSGRRRTSEKGDLTRTGWMNILAKFDHACCYCGSMEEITIEHLTPLSRGGTNDTHNIVPACWTCNSSKRNKLLEEFVVPEIAASIRKIAQM